MNTPGGLPKTYPEARWIDDLDPSGAETASDLESLEQDVLHVIQETLGSNGADPNKGVGILNYLSGTSDQLAAAGHIIDAQLGEFDRISSSQTTVLDNGDDTYTVTVAIAVGPQVVDFQFVIGPDGLTVK